MKNVDIAKKNYDKNLWSDEMLDALETKGKLVKADVTKLKADKKVKDKK